LKPTETPDLSAGLAAIQKDIADATAALNRAESERARCESEAVQLQAVVDRLPIFRETVTALYEAQASGDGSAAKKIPAVEKDLETQAEISGRAELNARGVRAASKKFAQQVADAQARIEALRTEEGRIKVRLLEADALREVAALDVEILDAVRRVYVPRAGRVLSARRLAKRFGGELSAREPNTVVAAPTIGVHQWSATPGGSISKLEYVEVDLRGEIETAAVEGEAQLVRELGIEQ